MRQLQPILIAGHFPPVREALVSLLRGLQPSEWNTQTTVAGWSVKDIAGHLLKGDLGVLSRRRDGYSMPGISISGWKDLVEFINNLNATWVQASRILSPQVLCDALQWTGTQVEEFFAPLDPYAPGVPVDWAGPAPAPNWMDVAREYTERWHHQQQIRDAVGQPGLKEKKFFAPVIDTFVRALPHGFRNVAAADGAVVEVKVSGESGGEWFLVREGATWGLFLGVAGTPAARITMDQDDAWRLFTKGLKGEAARTRVKQEGDPALCAAALHTLAIIG